MQIWIVFQVDVLDEEVIWQKSDALIRIYPPFKVLSLTKKVSDCVAFAREVSQFKIIILKEFVPSHLSSTNLLWGFEIGKVLVIGLDQELLLCSQKEIVECFYGINDGK